MHVVTFYSYKGGVGRTMALANVAILLAAAGKRVLLVDFDLEAPGLASYGALACAQGHKGLLDYVESYRGDFVAPDVADYIVECPVGEGSTIWLMPAGTSNTSDYTDRLNALDWDRLYQEEAGYLMFEDLRGQWENYQANGFDYILIDSRTGHTDVGGICTRHLPNAVVILFVPTAQNLDGLVPIVDGIRAERITGRRDIQLHFCPSNVPDEYDEEGILARLLDEAYARLKITFEGSSGPPIVHHRTSLELLEQPLIALDRPRSKLVKEYDQLKREIIAHNLRDREGALEALRRISRQLDDGSRSTNANAPRMVARLAEIMRLHPHDGEVALRAADCMSSMGDYEQAAQTTSIAINANHEVARAYLQRAVSFLVLGRKDEALGDLKELLRSEEGTSLEFRPAAQLLRILVDEPQPVISKLLRDPSLRTRAKLELATLMLRPDGDPKLVADQLLQELKRPTLQGDARRDAENAATLALIAAGRFGEAEQVGSPTGEEPALLFNRGMAEWGSSSKPPLATFRRVLDKITPTSELDANTHQCLALVNWVLGDKAAALTELEKAEERIISSGIAFSCWTYRYHTADGFLADLKNMRETLVVGRLLKPPVFKREKPASP